MMGKDNELCKRELFHKQRVASNMEICWNAKEEDEGGIFNHFIFYLFKTPHLILNKIFWVS